MALLFPLIMSAQTIVEGTIVDETNFPIPGVSIVIKGTTKGKVTDFDGKFSIQLDEIPSTLVISFLGYIPQEITVNESKKLSITLKENAQKLDEVVIVGYGSVERKDVTGSITSIKPDATTAQQSKGIEDIIKGRASGVQVTANGAEPGGAISVKIRGLSSLTGNSEPLYVVDGIIMDSATEEIASPISGYTSPQGGGVSGVNPSDIASVEILKDASATAIYGSRAANGVIIITTKKGKKGKAKFNFTSSLSTGTVVRNIDVLDTEGYANYQNDVNAALGFEPKYTINSDGSIFTTDDPPVQITGIDWSEDTYRDAIVRKNRLSISGGGEKGDYYLSGGMLDNKGTFPNASAKSADFSFKFNQKLSDRIKLTTKIATTYTELSATKGTDAFGSTNHSMVKQVILAAPILNFTDNNQDDDVNENIDGPRAWTTDYDDDSKEIRLLGSMTMDYKISKVFTYRLRFGGDYRKKERSFWYGNALLRGRNANGIAGLGTLNRFRYNVDNTLMFKKSFGKNHKINGTIGALIDKTSVKRTRYSASNFSDHTLRADGISFGSTFTPLKIDSEFPTILSFITRLNYTLFNKYLFTGTFRADGSSKFAKGNHWGYFPAFSFAWKVNEEAFLEDSKTISKLKVRLGYGEVGNQGIQSYRFLSQFDTPANGTGLLSDATGGALIPIVPLNLANPDLKWEASTQYNAGIDFGFFDNRLSGAVDIYQKRSNDLLLSVTLAPNAGFDKVIANQGDLESKGLEFSLSGDVIAKENLNWNIFANISFNKNKIAGLGIIDPKEVGSLGVVTSFFGNNIAGGTFFKQPANIFIKGREAALFYGLQTNGIIRTNDDLISQATGVPLKYKGADMRIGDVLFVDQNGDGDITDADNTIIGNPNPDFTFGFGSSFDYKNFSLSMIFNGVVGNDVANGNIFETGYANGTTKNTGSQAYYDAFDPVTNPNGNYPAVASDKLGNDYTRDFNDRIVEDGSFLRLSNVSLGYEVPVEKIDFFDSLKLTLSGQNLWLLTNYSGFDPEVNSFSFDPLRTGVDWGSFPNQRTFTFGLNATF